MKTSLTLASLSLTSSLFAFACGSAPSTPDSPTQPGPDLVGRWRSACVDPGTGQALRLTFAITPTTWALDYESFGDPACTAPVLVVHIDGPYSVTRPSPTIPTAHEARFAFATRTVTPRSAAAAEFLVQACGGGTYTPDTATDITAGCPGLGAYPHASCPADFDVVARTGDQLQFGARPADNNMCTEDRRPTALSPMILDRI